MKKIYLILIALVVALNLFSQPTDYIGYWPLNGNANDESVNANNGTPASISWVSGIDDNAASFNGTNAYVRRTVSDFQSGSSVGTISITFKTSSNGSIMTLFESSDTVSYDYYLMVGIHDDGRMRFTTRTTTQIDRIYSTIVTDGKWHTATIVMNGADHVMYVDGVIEAMTSGPNDGIWFDDILNRDNFTFGVSNRISKSNYFNGTIDDVKIYDRALNETEVKKLYTSSSLKVDRVGYWPLNGNTDDASVNNNDGSPGVSYTSGIKGQAASFNGTDDCIDINDSPSLSIGSSDDFSVSAWINSSHNSSQQMIIDKREGGGSGFFVRISGNGQIAFFMQDDASVSVEENNWGVGTILNDGNWHHVAVTVDRDGMATLYIDGVADPHLENVSSVTGAIGTSKKVGLGNANGSYFFNGKMDEVLIYNRVLTDIEIQELSNDGELIGHWKFDDDVTDASGNGNDGNPPFGDVSYVNGVKGKAASFDGAGDYISTTNANGYNNVKGSISFLLYVNDYSTFSTVLTNIVDSDNRQTIYITNSGYVYFYTKASGVGNVILSSNTISLNKWCHFVITYDYINDNYYMYINGNIENSQTTTDYNPSDIGNFQFGYDPNTGYLNGLLDEVKIYNKVLPESEIIELYKSYSLSIGVLGYWPLDGNANDASGNDNNGTLGDGTNSDTYPLETTGYDGSPTGAYSFDGVDDYINIPNSTSLEIGAGIDFSLSAWIKTSSLERQSIINKREGGGTGYFINLQPTNGQIRFYIHDGTLFVEKFNWGPSNLLNDGDWHHVALTVDRDNVASLYIDGEIQSGTLDVSSITGDVGTSKDLNLGQNGGGYYYFDGSMDEVLVYNRLLTGDEIRQLYDNYSLTVSNGEGSGIYESGQEITITANLPQPGHVFDQWTGDGTSHLANVASSTTTLTMPAQNISVTATYKVISSPWTEVGNMIYYNGKVAIGTTTVPSDFKLAVDGNIITREVKVTVDPDDWADFVFKPGYPLMPIHQLETYINRHKHLPSIPSENEVQENGVQLGEMNAKLLQKIEELTLYLIDVNTRMDKLEKENGLLNQKIEELEGNENK